MQNLSRLVISAVVMVAAMPLAVQAQEQATVPVISLDEAVTTALANNPAVSIARERVLRTQAEVREAGALALPQVSADAVYTRTDPVVVDFADQRVTIVPADSGSVTGRLTQAVDVFGRIRTAINLAEEQMRIQRLDLSRTERGVIFDVKTAYFNVLRAMAQRDVAQAAVDVAEERARLARVGFEAGTLARFDVTSAEVQVAILRQRLIAATNAIQVAQAALANTMGMDVTREFAIEPIVPTVLEPEIAADQAIETAYLARPEVRIAQAVVDLQGLAVTLSEKERLPLIGLFGQLERNLNPGAFATAQTWRLGANVTWSIWAGGATQARIRQAESDLRAAEDSLQQARLGVGLDVQSSLVALRDAYERMSAAEANVLLAEEALRLAVVRYQAGISTAVEVTAAEADLTQARTDQVNALYDYETALARFQRATGTEPELQTVVQTEAS